MILRVQGKEYSKIFAQIYDSANRNFPEHERGTSEADFFVGQLEQDDNFIYRDNGEICAFMSLRRRGAHTELTSLYVKQDCQRNGIGSALLGVFESKAQTDGLMFVDALRNAPWALSFYSRHGYLPLNEYARSEAEKIGMKEHSWSVILYKRANCL